MVLDKISSLLIIIILVLSSTMVLVADNNNAVTIGTIVGYSNFEQYGFSVSDAGDVNGDGIDDIIVGAPGFENNTGRAYIFFGGQDITQNLTVQYANVTLLGSSPGDYFGWNVSKAGDLNNDGCDDVIIGAPGNNSGAGAAYVFFGNTSWLLIITAGIADVKIFGDTTGDGLGTSLSSVGDVNADGFNDIIIGAPGNNSGVGAAFIIHGNNTMPPVINSSESDIELKGSSASGMFGFSVSNAGDVNKDNIKDVLVGAPGADSSKGRAFVFYGTPGFFGSRSAAGANVTLIGENTGNMFGWAVAGNGTVNGDSYDDLVIGAPLTNSRSGTTYIFYGDNFVSGTTLNAGSDANVTLSGENPGDCFGSALEIDIDNNNDTFNDILIGAPGVNGTGKVYHYFGSDSLGTDIPAKESDNNWSGENTGDRFGSSVSAAGNPDSNLFEDLIIGAPQFDSLFRYGKSYLITINTYLDIKWIKTYDNSYVEKSTFTSGSRVNIKVNISSFYDPGNTTTASIKIISPSNSVLVDNLPMLLENNGSNIPLSWSLFNYSFNDTSVSGIYTIEIRSTKGSGVSDLISTTITMIPGGPDQLTISADPSVLTANGTSHSEITVHVNDSGGNHLSGLGSSLSAGIILGNGSLGPITEVAGEYYRLTYTSPTSPIPEAIIKVSLGILFDTVTITLLPPPLGRLVILPDRLNITAGESYGFSVLGFDNFDNIVNLSGTLWSTNAGSFTNRNTTNALFQARTTAGTGFVNVTVGSIKVSSLITILPDSLASIVVAPDSADIVLNNSRNFTASGFDKYTNAVGLAGTVWSTNVGTIASRTNSTATFLAQAKPGTGYISASSGPVTGNGIINIVPEPLFKLTISPGQKNVLAGKNLTFTVIGTDRNGFPLQVVPVWTTNIGTMSGSTLFAQTKIASGFVNATVDGISDSAEINIVPDVLNSIVIQPGDVELTAGKYQVFTADGYDRYGNSVPISPNWASSIGKMDGNNFSAPTFTSKGIIAASSLGITGHANVTIVAGELYSVFVSPSIQEVVIGSTFDFDAIGYDEYLNIVDISPMWSTDVGEMVGNRFYARDTPGTGTVTATVILNSPPTEIKGTAVVNVIFGKIPGQPVIKSRIPDQEKYEDSPPWFLDLTPFESDDEDSGKDLVWSVTGEDTSLYILSGENSADDILKFTPVPDAHGNNLVTFWLEDSDGNKASQMVWINLTPVNDAPRIYGAPDLSVHHDSTYTFDYEPYVSDKESHVTELSLSCRDSTGKVYTEVSGFKVTYNYPVSLVGTDVFATITVTDGQLSGSDTIKISVTEEWVPFLETELPDVTLMEGEVKLNVFDLDDHFSDPNGQGLHYSVSDSHVSITINANNTVDIASKSDWSGAEEAIFRAKDSKSGLAEDSILIVVLPVNDPPSISKLPDMLVHYEHDYRFDLTEYVHDIDNETSELRLFTSDPDNIRFDPADHLIMIANYPRSMVGMSVQVTITVTDGIYSNARQFMIKVTDNFPPELNRELPDVYFEEDTELVRSIDLDDYFIDKEGGTIYYTNYISKINVIIYDDNTVSFSAGLNWYGTEQVTFRATDFDGAFAEDTVKVTVIPVNDPPVVKKIPDQAGRTGEMWVLDLGRYISDVDDNITELAISINSDIGTISGSKLIFRSGSPFEGNVQLTVGDGEFNSTVSFHVSITGTDDARSNYYLLILAAIFIMIAVLVSSLFIFRKRRSDYEINEIYLIHKKGKLLVHKRTEEDDKISGDGDAPGVGLKELIRIINDSYSKGMGQDLGKASGKSLRNIDLDDTQFAHLNLSGHNILVLRGKYSFMAVIHTGSGSRRLGAKIAKIHTDIESEHQEQLSKRSIKSGEITELKDSLDTLIPVKAR